MRFIVRINLSSDEPPSDSIFIPDWVNDLLPVQGNGTCESFSWRNFSYSTNDKSIVEANWDSPFYSENSKAVFIGGYVLYRIKEADKRGKYIPSPKEVLEILLEHGDHHYEILKGNYHIIFFDKKRHIVNIYSSPFSLYPAWYMVQDGVLYISDLLEVLIKRKQNLKLNIQGLVEFSLFDHCLGSTTLYEGIFQLIGGQKLTFVQNKINEETIYDLSRWITKKPKSKKTSLEEINATLTRHISEFVDSVKRFNLSLTGGFDGRLNLSFVKHSDFKKLQAFSYGKKDSLQISIPQKISSKLKFLYKPILLDHEFEGNYSKFGMDAIINSGGITPFIRANYPYAYSKISAFSRNCIIGQCDVIRPLFTNPAGAIFNSFSKNIFFGKDDSDFYFACNKLAKEGFLNQQLFTKDIIESIYNAVRNAYIIPYVELTANEQFYIFLLKESMLKFWHTECHIVDLYVNDFISFSDLDYLETISGTEYFGLYKGIFATNQFQRRKGHDLYYDLMKINNNVLNNIITDRFFKPKWIGKSYFGYFMIAFGKLRLKQRLKRLGDDTFGGLSWSKHFYLDFNNEIYADNQYFNLNNLKRNEPYQDNNRHRLDRHISIKLWLQYIGLK